MCLTQCVVRTQVNVIVLAECWDLTRLMVLLTHVLHVARLYIFANFILKSQTCYFQSCYSYTLYLYIVTE